MNYIIQPSVFYWIHVIYGLKVFFITASIFIPVIILLISLFWDDCGADEKRIRRLIRVLIVIFVISVIGAIFIPNKETMIEIILAKVMTVENTTWTLDTVRKAVDYIVAMFQSIK